MWVGLRGIKSSKGWAEEEEKEKEAAYVTYHQWRLLPGETREQYIFSSVIERVQVESLRDLVFSKSAQ
jgi:hypothetical protein